MVAKHMIVCILITTETFISQKNSQQHPNHSSGILHCHLLLGRWGKLRVHDSLSWGSAPGPL